MVVKFEKIDRSLRKKGFQCDDTSNHIRYRLYVDGKKTPIHTMISHNRRPIPDNLLSSMARELRITRAELQDLIDCPLTEEAYVRILKRKGMI